MFVTEWGWDLYGIGQASTLTALILLASTMTYTHCLNDFKEALFWPDGTVWVGWVEYLSLGIPSTGILCTEYWAWQFMAIVSGYLGVEAQANMMITMQITLLSNTFCIGIQEAACVLIGNKIGANDVPLAKRFAVMTLFQAMTFALIVSVSLYAFREEYTRVFGGEGKNL